MLFGNDKRGDPMNPADRPQSPWRDDEMDRVSTESCRTVAAIRAVDAEDATVDFDEPLAAWLAGDDWVARIRRVKTAAGQYGQGLISDVTSRCAAVDAAVLKRCRGGAGIRQVVLLGAGMDTRAYRLPLPEVTWIEVDVPEMSRTKRHLIEQAPEHLRPHTVVRARRLEYLPLDLASALDALPARLLAAGFEPDAPVLYVLEGLVYYLTGEENRALFEGLPAPPGSQALVTCIPSALKRLVNDPDVQERVPLYKAVAPSWKTDLDELRAIIENRWTIVQEINLFDDAERNGRRLARTPDIGLDRRTIAESLLVMNAFGD